MYNMIYVNTRTYIDTPDRIHNERISLIEREKEKNKKNKHMIFAVYF